MNQRFDPPLNCEQKQAVEYDGKALLVLAGAGSGKTRVITYKIAHILAKTDIAPWQILAITFTNKAAAELKRRLHKLIGSKANHIWAQTFHAACLRILRREHEFAGLTSNFVIYDTSDCLQLIKNILRETGIDKKMFKPNSFLSAISAFKSEMLEPEEVEDYSFERILFEVFHLYNNRLKQANALDFDDIILRTITLLNTSRQIADKYQKQFKYIFVDEYQDTNVAQYKLLKSLYNLNNYITVVGDTNQSIYSFRGADIRNILEFENDWQNAKTIILNQNYRSTNTILQAANAIISSVDKQSKQKLWSNLGKGTKIKLCKTDNEDAEAEYVTKEIQRLINIGNYKPKDIAVFYRMNSMSRPVEQALMFQAIPYKVIGGTKFYDRKEIRDIMAYLKIIHNPSDDISLLRIINFPTRGLGKTSLDKVIEFARSQSLSIYQALQQIDQITTLSPSTMRKFQDFTQMISFLQLTASDILNPKTATDITSFINDVVTKTALKEHFEFSTDPQDQVRLENIEAFVNVAKSWKTEEPEPTLEHFLEILALMSDTDDLPDTNQTDGFVSLMTLHSAKGLEYPIVFFIGLEDGTIPSSLSMNSQAELNEERRLAYVGVTRAKELLYLSWSTSRLVWGQITSFLPSPYLLDINLEIVTKEEYKNNKYSYKNNNKPKYKFHKY